MNGITDHGQFGRLVCRWACGAIAFGCAPGLSFGFSGTISAPEYQAVSDIAGQVIRNAQSSSKFINGVRGLAATVEVAGTARSLASGRVTVALAATAAAALAAYCYSDGSACNRAGSGLKDYLTPSRLLYSPDQNNWQKPVMKNATIAYFVYSPNTYQPYATFGDACSAAVGVWNSSISNRTFSLVSVSVDANGISASCKLHGVYKSGGTDAGYNYQPVSTKAGQIETYVPAGLEDIASFINANPLPDSALNDWPEPLPVPVNAPVVKPSVVALGDPYAGPDPSTGWRQDYAQVDPKPAPAPWYDVNVTTGTGVVDNPNTGTVEGPKTVDETDPTTGDQTKPDTTETKDPGLCDMYPDILACQKLGTAPGDQVPKKTVNVTYAPESVDLPSGCPDDLDMGNGQKFSYATTCSNISKAKPLVLALASFAALTLVIAVIRRG